MRELTRGWGQCLGHRQPLCTLTVLLPAAQMEMGSRSVCLLLWVQCWACGLFSFPNPHIRLDILMPSVLQIRKIRRREINLHKNTQRVSDRAEMEIHIF